MKEVYILGFYYRDNLGDDAMAHTFKLFFQKYYKNTHKVVVINTDDLADMPTNYFSNAECIIVGGGNLIDNYFLDKIKPILQHTTCPIYAIGIDFPYPNMIDDGACDIFDFIITRNQIDYQRLINRYGSSYVRYFPDLTNLLPKLLPTIQLTSKDIRVKYGLKSNKKNIGVFLARPIYKIGKEDNYQNVLNSLATFFSNLSKNYHILLYSMNTHLVNNGECDIYINNDLKNHSLLINKKNVVVIDRIIDIEDIPLLFNSFYCTINTRFHSHIFSIISSTPFISISNTRKVETLIKTIDTIKEYSFKYDLDLDKKYIIGLDSNKLNEVFSNLVKNYNKYQKLLVNYKNTIKYEIDRLDITLQNLLWNKIYRLRSEIPYFQSIFQDILNKIKERVLYYLVLDPMDYPEKIESFYTLYKMLNRNINKKESEMLAKIVLYSVVGKINCEYSYGLIEKILNPDFVLSNDVKWILNNENKTPPNIPKCILTNNTPLPLRKLKINNYENEELKGYHRSGWPFVLKHLRNLDNKEGILFNSYLDKTFGWQIDFLTEIGVLPYREDWIGVFHHTPDENYSPNNLITTFKHPSFKKSLSKCRGIIVLSKYLHDWVKTELNALKYSQIPILVIKHPTDRVNDLQKFTIEKLKQNPDPKVIQIGAWLRDTYMIYDLPQPLNFTKAALKGKGMENYYPESDFLPKIKQGLLDIGCHHQEDINNNNICRPICRQSYHFKYCNKYIAGMYYSIKRKDKSVKLISTLDENDYDKLLTENVVMIYLCDVSACNTIIECLIRNTPILINRHPAVTEYIGEDYPFYYNSVEEAQSKLNDIVMIKNAYNYILNKNKDDLSIEYFMNKFTTSNLYISL
jgi:exopolysaccharide biosynthesis predicted pyruvyltransferase EpsI